MPSAFKSSLATAVGTTSVDIYTAPAVTTTTVIGFSVANIVAAEITVSATITKGGTTASLVRNTVIPIGGTVVLVGGDQKLVLEAGNKISVIANTIGSVDVVVSVLELS